MKKLQIGIIGSAGVEEYPFSKPSNKLYELAYEIGTLIAKNGSILICGGKGGIMEEACRGAKENGGITVGVIGGNNRGESNKYVDVEVVSGITNYAEEGLIISMSDGIIALGGGAGTLQELAMAYRSNKKVATIKNTKGWSMNLSNQFLDERNITKIKLCDSPKSAVSYILKNI